MKKVRSSQASISINSYTVMSKTQLFPVSIVKCNRSDWYRMCNFSVLYQERIQRFWKGVGLLYIGHHDWPMKNILGFGWSKKAKITLETIRFWQNVSISTFKFSPPLYAIKACQWNLINFSKLAKALIRKEKKHLCSSQWEKKGWEKLDFVLKQVVL